MRKGEIANENFIGKYIIHVEVRKEDYEKAKIVSLYPKEQKCPKT